MEFLVVGLNHRTAPLEVREKLTVTKAQLPGALKAMGSYVSQGGLQSQGVILSTCNRSEVYALGQRQHLEKSLEDFLAEYFDIPLIDVDRYLYSYHHEECIHHLFRVASSLDSMILGEGQILRQVRDAFEASVQANTVGGSLSRLFHQALRVGKRVRRDTGISRNALSVSRACVELARQLLGDPSMPSGQALRQLRVMVIGTGDAGKLAARALKESGVNEIVVTNRTYERAVELAHELAGEAIPFQEMPDALKGVDIAIGSTGSPGYVLKAEVVDEAMAVRPERPLFLIDIAVPRDIDPVAAHVINVFLYDVDDLQTISEANRLEREQEAQRAEEIVIQEVTQFLEWYRTLEVIPTITALRERAEETRERELAKLLRKLEHKLTPQEIGSLDAMTRSIVNKLLHNPTTYIKELHSPDDPQTSEKLRLVKKLFNLKVVPTLGDEAPSVTEEFSHPE